MTLSQRSGGIEVGKGQEAGVKRGREMRDRVDRLRGIEILIPEGLVKIKSTDPLR